MSNSMLAERTSAFPTLQSTGVYRRKVLAPVVPAPADDCASCKLRTTSFFCALSERAGKALDRIKRECSYPEGAYILTEGEAARGVYILCQGRAKLLTTNSDGKTFILKLAQPGEVFGLNSVVMGTPHEISVETLQPCRMAFIHRDDFLRFMKEDTEVCMQVVQHLGRDCRAAYEVIRSIGLSSSASEKLARFLVEWSSHGRITDGILRVKLALTHEEMAQLIGCSRETVSRTLSEFKRQRYVEFSGATLVVRNRAALESLAAS